MKTALCYIEGDEAWFTTQELSKQWGDDWDDAPYSCNAGAPCSPRPGEDHEVFRVKFVDFSRSLQTPADRHGPNSGLSVEMINRGEVPWLWSDCGKIKIFAGATLCQFAEGVRSAGGMVLA
jgi:hypothetical protein